MSHQCVRYKKKITNSFNFRCVGIAISLSFLESSATFFFGEQTQIFGRALSRSHMVFFQTFLLCFGCVLEETHVTAYLDVVPQVREEHRTSSLKSFFARTSPPRRRHFWARPLKTDHRKLNACDICSLEAHLKVFFLAAFLVKRISTLITTGKQREILKVRQKRIEIHSPQLVTFSNQ